jgi:hypothetical protein
VGKKLFPKEKNRPVALQLTTKLYSKIFCTFHIHIFLENMTNELSIDVYIAISFTSSYSPNRMMKVNKKKNITLFLRALRKWSDFAWDIP